VHRVRSSSLLSRESWANLEPAGPTKRHLNLRLEWCQADDGAFNFLDDRRNVISAKQLHNVVASTPTRPPTGAASARTNTSSRSKRGSTAATASGSVPSTCAQCKPSRWLPIQPMVCGLARHTRMVGWCWESARLLYHDQIGGGM